MHLSVTEFLKVLRDCEEDDELCGRLAEVFQWVGDVLARAEKAYAGGRAIGDAARVAQYGHQKYLPAAKAYREYLQNGGSTRTAEFRSLRARLGGVSRWHYLRQKDSFRDLVRLLCPGPPPPDDLVSVAWERVRKLESRLLTHYRKVT